MRGYSVMLGYWGDPRATASSIDQVGAGALQPASGLCARQPTLRTGRVAGAAQLAAWLSAARASSAPLLSLLSTHASPRMPEGVLAHPHILHASTITPTHPCAGPLDAHW